jgi:hypothetical protein
VRKANGRAVYTPQVMLNGRDARSWGQPGDFLAKVDVANAVPARADLSLKASATANGFRLDVSAALRDALLAPESVLFLAVTEDKLVSEVRAGENRGATLRHDYIVRELRSLPPFDAGGLQHAVEAFAIAPGWKAKDLSAVAFVQSRRTGEVLQALKLPLCAG